MRRKNYKENDSKEGEKPLKGDTYRYGEKGRIIESKLSDTEPFKTPGIIRHTRRFHGAKRATKSVTRRRKVMKTSGYINTIFPVVVRSRA